MLSKKEIETRNKCDRYMCRGMKEYSDEFVYGYYLKSNFYINQGKIVTPKIDAIIKNETLSQCTGVKDENEVMSFGNDIVHIEVFSEKLKCLIKWIDGYFFFVDRKGRIRGIEIDFEIIGDRFSNPELLGDPK